MELFEDLHWVWETFTLLNRQRQVGPNGPQPIAVHDIQAICALKQIIRSDDVELILFLIPELDHIVLKQHYDEMEAKLKKKTKENPKGRRR